MSNTQGEQQRKTPARDARDARDSRDAKNIPDNIRNTRIYLHRLLDIIFDDLTTPDFTGTVELKISGKDGRPGQPESTVRRYGVHDF
jgi:hypothetical protein